MTLVGNIDRHGFAVVNPVFDMLTKLLNLIGVSTLSDVYVLVLAQSEIKALSGMEFPSEQFQAALAWARDMVDDQ